MAKISELDESTIVLSNGTKVKAYGSVLGIGPDLSVDGGWDDDHIDLGLSPGEKIELADYAISLWTRYREDAVMRLTGSRTE